MSSTGAFTTTFVNNALDVIKGFHRDELAEQRSELRVMAKTRASEAEEALALGLKLNPFFVVDKAREFGREYLVQQYGEEKVNNALKQ